MKNLFFLFCFFIPVDNLFCQEEKTAGGPKFDFYLLPGNISVKSVDTLFICPNNPLQLAMVNLTSDPPSSCNVTYWKKNGVPLANTSSNTLTITDPGVYSPEMTCGSFYWLARQWVVRSRLSIYKLPENISLSASYNLLNLCANDSFQLKLVGDSIYPSCYNYLWKKNGVVIPNSNTAIYTVTDPGVYNVSLTCSSCGNITIGNYEVTCSTSATNNQSSNSVLFPNPANKKLYVQLQDGKPATITIYNTLGEIVLIHKTAVQTSEMDISQLNEGVYYFSINNGVSTTTMKILKAGD